MNFKKLIAAVRRFFTPDAPLPCFTEQEPHATAAAPRAEAKSTPTANLHIVLDAVTQACSQFVQQHVRPIADYQPDMGYAIRTIRLLVTPANARLVQDISRMNPAARDMLVSSCVRKAVGSALISLDDFYGLTLEGDDAMLEGQVIKVLRCNDENFQPLHFVFDGEYKVIPFSREAAPASPPETDRCAIPAAAKEPELPATLGGDEGEVFLPQAGGARETVLAASTRLGGAAETELVGTPASAVALAYLRVRDAAGEQLVPVASLPFVIGREPEDGGYRVADQYQRVSRQHLRLTQTQGGSGFLVDNLATDRNGTYCQGQPQGARFVWPVASRDTPEQGWLVLGSRSLTAGGLQVRLERNNAAAECAA